jgi:hypothetical protein
LTIPPVWSDKRRSTPGDHVSFLDNFDLRDGDLPPWITKLVAVTRPLTTSGIIAIPVMGAFTVGTVAGFDFQTGMNMSKASTHFLQGIPDAAYAMIAAVALGYSASKTTEAIKAPRPVGGTSPENPAATTAPAVPPSVDLSRE